MALQLTNDMRLTLIQHYLTSAIAGDTTLYQRLLDLGAPIDELLADTPPLASPPYSREEFEALLRYGEPAARLERADRAQAAGCQGHDPFVAVKPWPPWVLTDDDGVK